MKPKILILDIETSYIEVKHRTFSLFNNDYISHKDIEQDWYIHCIGYKWLDSKTAKVISTHQDRHKFDFDHTWDEEVVTKFYDILKEADLAIGHNLDSFDLKKLNTRFITYGLAPIIMPPTVDTLKVARKYFKFTSNKLDYIADFLIGDCKIDTESGLWEKAFQGDYKATKKMAEYCKQDVIITEKVYLKLRQHAHNHPSLAKIKGFHDKKTAICPVCTSKSNKLDGHQNLSAGRYQYHKCLNCGYRYKGKKVND